VPNASPEGTAGDKLLPYERVYVAASHEPETPPSPRTVGQQTSCRHPDRQETSSCLPSLRVLRQGLPRDGMNNPG